MTFTYSVRWSSTPLPYDERLARYERFPLNPIHLEVCVDVSAELPSPLPPQPCSVHHISHDHRSWGMLSQLLQATAEPRPGFRSYTLKPVCSCPQTAPCCIAAAHDLSVSVDDCALLLLLLPRFVFVALCLQIHWFSIINSCVTVLLLTGFLATILMRVLRADFAKFSRGADDSECCVQAHCAALGCCINHL